MYQTRIRKLAVLATALVAGAATVLNGPATGAPSGQADSASAQYSVRGPRTVADRNAVAGPGAAIDLVEHGIVYITGHQAEVAQITRLVSRSSRSRSPTPHVGEVGITTSHRREALYHNYDETNAD